MKELNIAKGFAMLGILYIHLISILGQPSAEVHFKYQSFNLSSICGFVLPMFFVIAGFTYSKTKKTIKNELQQRVLQLLKYFTKYFIVIGAMYSVVVLVLKKLTFTECLQGMVCEYFTRATCEFIGEGIYFKTVFHDLFVGVWYVWVYMLAMTLFILVMKIPTKSFKEDVLIFGSIGIVSAAVYAIFPELPFEANIVPSIVLLMYASQLIKKYKIYQKLVKLAAVKRILINFVCFLFGAYCLSFTSVTYLSHGTFSNPYGSMGIERIPNIYIWMFAITGIMLASFVFFCVCRDISKIPVVGDFLSYLGVNSLDTMLLHPFFALTICELFDMKCGRLLTANDDITPMIKLQCYVVFGVTLFLCYYWPKLKMNVLKMTMKRKGNV